MIFFPNGKINLGLSVINKRTDGYHNIETVMYPVPVFDVLEFLPSGSFSLSIYGFKITGSMEDNLVYKAWKMLHDRYQIPPVEVKLLKMIPPGSGLGGGSSDSTFFLKALNEHFSLLLPEETLSGYALQLGSDCPFFLNNKPALVQGRGEIIQEIPLSLKGKYFCLVFPNVTIATAEAYQKITPGVSRLSVSEVVKLPVEQWQHKMPNDFEPFVLRQHPELEEIKDLLYSEGAVYASMTGSGSAFFGIFNKPVKIKHKFHHYLTLNGTLN